MNNPLMNVISGISQNNSIGNLKNMLGMIKVSGNPDIILQNMAQSDPAIKKAFEMCRGKNPQEVFLEECQKTGKNPQDIIGMLK